MNIAIIDDNHIVLKKIYDELRNSANEESVDCSNNLDKLNDHTNHLEKICLGENTYYLFFVGVKDSKPSISSFNNNICFDILIADWTYYSYYINNGKLKASELPKNCLDVINLFEGKIKKDCEILIYSYYPNAYPHIRIKRKKEIAESLNMEVGNITYLETSEIFRLSDKKAELWNGDDNNTPIVLGLKKSFEEYAVLIKHVIDDFVAKKNNSSKTILYSYFNLNSFAFFERLPLLNKLLPDELNTFKVGLISTELYLTDNKKVFAIDIPYKHYYKDYDDLINRPESSLEALFIENKPFSIHCKVSLSQRKINILKENNCNKNFEEAFVSFMPILEAGLFYKNNFTAIKNDFNNKSNLFTTETDVESDNCDVYELIYLKNRISIEEYSKGFLHLCLIREYNSNNSKLTTPDDYSGILKDSFIDPIILPLVEEQLIPDILKKERQTSKRNEKLDLAAYNISHTYSSHVFPFIDQFLEKIQNKIYELYEPTSNCDETEKKNIKENLENLKLYQKDQKEKMVALAMSLSAANNRFNVPMSSIFYTSYSAKNVFNEKLGGYYFAKAGDSHNECYFENGLSLGITDGQHSCMFNLSNGENFEIDLPFGEIGNTMLMMLVANLFRNLYKHSKASKNCLKYKKVQDLEIDTRKLKESEALNSKTYFKIDAKLEEIVETENEHKLFTSFSNQYYTLRLIEKSREYDNNCRSTKDKICNLNKWYNDWSEENSDNWKGLKEIRMIASILIGCPIEEIDFTRHKENACFEHNGQVFPSKLVEVKLNNNRLEHIIYLRKSKLASVWLNDDEQVGESTINTLEGKGICFKKASDEKEPTGSYKFILDYSDEAFNVKKSRKHYNFRYIKPCKSQFAGDIKELCNNPEKFLSKKWIEENECLNVIDTLQYKNYKKKEESSSENKCEKPETIFGSNNENNSDKKQIAIIDNHFGCLAKESDEDVKKYPYKESNSSKCLNDLMAVKNSELEYLQREAVHTQVIIYDEVLWESANHEIHVNWNNSHSDEEEKNLIETLEWTNINLQENVNNQNIKESFSGNGTTCLCDLIEDINTKFPKHNKRFAYIIVHYSGLEKLIENSKEALGKYFKSTTDHSHSFIEYLKLENSTERRFENLDKAEHLDLGYQYLVDKLNCRGHSTYVVLSSGKYPGSLPKNSYFCDRQTLDYLIRKVNSKIQLTQLLGSLRVRK